MNRETNEYEPTDGDGYAQWFAGRNNRTGRNLVRLTRLVKFIRDEHEWAIKSILLTTLLGLQVRDTDGTHVFSDVPTSLWVLLQRVDVYLESLVEMPEIANPALPEETFIRHWDNESFVQFRDNVHQIAVDVNDAYQDGDVESSADRWREVFGERFEILDEDLEGGQALSQAALALGNAAHALPVYAIPVSGVDIRYTVRVDGWVYNLKGTKRFRGVNSNAKVLSGHALKFRAWTNAPEPYDVRWQVVNTGAHAAREGQLRGEFAQSRRLGGEASADKLVTWETTKYTFIVKNGVCVGRSRPFYVNIKNPQF
jgi:hypothetical protein